MQNSAKERIKDVQTKQEAGTCSPALTRGCGEQGSDPRPQPDTRRRSRAGACIVGQCMRGSGAAMQNCRGTEKNGVMLESQLWKANNPAARTDEGTCSGISVL